MLVLLCRNNLFSKHMLSFKLLVYLRDLSSTLGNLHETIHYQSELFWMIVRAAGYQFFFFLSL